MNKKIIGIFFCIIMICLLFEPFISAQIISNKIKLDDDIPVWEIGDKWSYNIDNIDIYLSDEKGFIELKPSTLILEVTDVSKDIYIVDYELKISGNLNIYSMVDLKFGGLFPISFTGSIEYNKSDMGIKNIISKISGVCKLKPTSFPLLSLPVRLDIQLDLDSSTPFTIITFPLFVEKYWGIKSTNLSVDGYIKSPMLRLINLIHNILRFFKFIPEEYIELSDTLTDILPVIQIKHTLSVLNITNYFFINESAIPQIFGCINYEQITIQGNTLECYNITIAETANIYYSPQIGNIAKVYIQGENLITLPFIEDHFTEISNINIELLKTN